MYKDEIISEVWANREAYMEKHGHDISTMVQDLMERQNNSSRRIVDRRNEIPGAEIDSDSSSSVNQG